AESGLAAALKIKEKLERYKSIGEAKNKIMAFCSEALGEAVFEARKKSVSECFNNYKSNLMRFDVLDSKTRLDGRGYSDIRPICNEIEVLPRAHGSALFTRGETQALVSVTLGTRDDEQRLDTLTGETSRRFMLHYNFPPFSVGEARGLRGTSRREIGHGALAERAVQLMTPSESDFPYTIRIVSEITESNGSSSMASVCGSTLALWDAGVHIKAPVAGIAMGLIKEGEKIAVLSDILGDEDHLGDMDFKVCGTENGITAIQMDIKIDGLSKQILSDALDQARQGRLHILQEMKKTIDAPREKLSELAPRIMTLKINPEKIRDVIGPGGRVIRDIIARTGAKVEITDDGVVHIAAVGSVSVDKAIKIIEDLTREAEVNRVYKGMVRRLMDFGAFVELFPGTEGLCHISELSENRVTQVSDVISEGDEVNIAVLSIDRDGKIRLSRKRAQGKNVGDFI
ncbi:MAG: polyribonucleotide nucleotidyltransferase, partial [bacterium]|nr:polyribonucleotide nucleotidyltransferase [bacterium]